MADYGVTDEGFKRKKLDTLLEELNAEMKAIFGENFNVSPESPDGQVNGTISESNANLWELAQECYDAFNPSAAAGTTLSDLVQLNGITRLAASPSLVVLELTGVAATIVPQGSLVSTSDSGLQYATDLPATIGGGGTALVGATALVTGPEESLAGTVTQIDTPISGWASVTNPADATEGRNEETDPELRARRESSVAGSAQAILDSIFSAVAQVPGVVSTTVLENDTDAVDINGLPAHSFHVIVTGGDDTDIGEAIWSKKPAGIQSFGSTIVQIDDSQGIPHGIGFSRPAEVPIYVDVVVTPIGDYPPDGDTLIAESIVAYANGELIAGRGFPVGQDVIYTELYTPINAVPGHEITSLFIGLAPAPVGTSNIPISAAEISAWDVANIVVNS